MEGRDWSILGWNQWPFCVSGNERSDSVKVRICVGHVSDCQFREDLFSVESV